MKKQLLFAIFAILFSPISLLFAQNTLCGQIFTDPEGPNANYSNNADYTLTLYPNNPGEVVTVTFTSFDLETTYDGLYIYDGPSITSSQISSNNAAGNVPGGLSGAFWGNVNPGSFTSSDPSGCLTFRFRSDANVVRPGWIANVICSTPGNCLTPNNLFATNFTGTSATVGWVESGNATQWEVLVLPNNSPAPTPSSTGTLTTDNPYTVTGLTAGIVYMAYVRAICGINNLDSNWSYPVTIVTTSTECTTPTNTNVSNISNSSATVSWPINSGAVQWEIFISLATAGAPTPNTTGNVVSINTFQATGLNPGTSYNFYIRSICNGAISSWSSGAYFTTSSNPITTPACGEIFYDNGGANANYANSSDNTYVICPTNAGNVVTVTFTSFNTETNWDGIYVYDGNSINATQIASTNPAGNGTAMAMPGAFWGTTIPGPFTSTSADGCLTFRFRSDSSVTSQGWVANVTCSSPPTCPTPTNLTVTNSSPNTVTFTWTPIPGVNQYTIKIGNDTYTTSSNPFLVSNLAAGVYTASIRALCTPNDISAWSNLITFIIQPSCLSPQQLFASNITGNSYTANWFETGTATSWEVVTQPCGSPAPTSTTIGTISNTNTLTIENLNSGTCYHFYVRSLCTLTDLSTWSGPFVVTTLVLPPACGGNFFDPAGPSANYANNIDSTVTICPNNPGELVTVTFTQFNTEANWDGLLVYNGSSTSAPQIASTNGTGNSTLANLPGAFWGSTIPGPFTSSSPDGCLTFRFISDASVTGQGWAANVSCVQDADKIIMVAFVDLNNNGIKEATEPNFSNGSFLYDMNDLGTPMTGYSPTGQYAIYDTNPTNSYDLSYQIQASYAPYYSAGTTNYSNVSIPVGSIYQIFYFPVIVTQGYNDVTVSIVSQNPPPRPGFTYSNKIVYRNQGLTPTSGTLTFTKDPIVTITGINQVGTVANASGFTYAFSNLMPNEVRYFTVTMSVPTIPTVSLGDLVTNSATVSAPADDINLDNNSFSISQTIVGSYDPNDKMESHGGRITISDYDPSDYLFYTVRFQNEGTASAEFVIIEDNLDAQIDENSIQMVNSSHHYTMTRNENHVKWEFRNINLVPAIVNELASMGYVQFKVRLKPGIEVGDIVPNLADIFFDFNPPITTNMFNTEFVAPLSNPNFETGNFEMYPNPANTTVQISMHDSNESIRTITIYDIIGKKVMSLNSDATGQTVDVSSLTSGIYMVEITTENNLKLVKKLVKE